MAKKGSLTEKAGIVIFARITNTVMQLAIVITAIQILNKTDFAIIGYLLMIHQIVREIACLGFPQSIFFFFERVARGARKAFALQTSSILAVMALLAGGVMLAIRALAPHLLANWSASDINHVQYLLFFMGLVTVLEIPVWPVTNILLATERQKQAAWYDIFNTSLNFFCFAVPLWLGYPLTIAVYGLVLYAVVRFIVSIIWAMLVLPGSVYQHPEISVKRQIRFSGPLGVSSMMGRINFFADKFVVSLLLSAAAFANYTIGAQEVPIVRVIPFAVSSVLISRYIRLELQSKKDELLQLWHKGIEKTSLIVLPLAILSIVVAPDLIQLIASSKHTSYAAAVIPFQIYNLIMLLRVTNYSSILQAFDDTKGVLYLSIHLVVANIILSIPLTIWLGIAGTALATLLASCYNWMITMRRIAGHMEIGVFDVLPFPFYGKVLGICAGTGITVGFTRFYFLSRLNVWEGLSYSVSLYLILFGIAGTFFGVISQKDWRDFGNWMRLRFFTA
jgi:O-antigen/teichoic acid export membrane protein